MITVRLFNDFSKRPNSTKRPSSDGGRSYSCSLKDNCGVIRPVLKFAGIDNPTSYNYAYVGYFGRYYYIEEWTWIGGVWEAQLTSDALATAKTAIGGSTQYVLRSSAESDGNITDDYYPAVAVTDTYNKSLGAPVHGYLSSGKYVIGVINGSSTTQRLGSVVYYVCSAAEFSAVCEFMFDEDADYLDLDNIEASLASDVTTIALPKEIMKSLINPMQYVVSCMFFPSTFDIPTAGSGNIHFGWWNSGISASRVGGDGSAQIANIDINLHAHPQAKVRGNYLNLAPYSRHVLFAGPFGVIPIDNTYFASDLSGSLQVNLDAITGVGTIQLRNHTNDPIFQIEAQVGVPISLSSITRDYLGTVANTVDTAAGAVSSGADIAGHVLGGDIAGAVGAGASGVAKATSGIVSTIKGAQPTLMTAGGGSSGSMSINNRPWHIISQHFTIADDDKADLGAPLCQKRQISEIPGYIMVSHADISTTLLESENNQIRAYMEGGFFYE